MIKIGTGVGVNQQPYKIFNPESIPDLSAAFDDRSVFNADGSGNLTSIEGYNSSVFVPLNTAPVVETDATTGKTIVRATNGTTGMNLETGFTAQDTHTVIAVYRSLNSDSFNNGFLGFGNDTTGVGNRFACLFQQSSAKDIFYGRNQSNANVDLGRDLDNNWTLLWLRYNSTTSLDIGINDEFVTVNLDHNDPAVNGVNGTNFNFFTIDTFSSLEDMAFASFAHYTRALTDVELVTYLRAQVAKYNIPNIEGFNDSGIVGTIGQSNMERMFTNYGGVVDVAFEDTLDNFYPNVVFFDGATGGSCLRKSAHDYLVNEFGSGGSAGYLYNDTTGVFEDLYNDEFLTGVDGAIYNRRLVKYVLTDGNYVQERAACAGASPIDQAGWKPAMLALSTQLRQNLNSVCKIGFFLGPNINKETTNTVDADANFQQFIDFTFELVDEYPDRFFIAAQGHDTSMPDDLHYSEADGERIAPRMARKVAAVDGKSVTGVDGPRITVANYDGSTVTVTVAQDAGTDFDTTITSPDVDQFHIEADGVNVAVSSIAYTNATTLTLTMASSLAGSTEVLLWNAWNTGYNLTAANIITDNATPAMPLQRASRVEVRALNPI